MEGVEASVKYVERRQRLDRVYETIAPDMDTSTVMGQLGSLPCVGERMLALATLDDALRLLIARDDRDARDWFASHAEYPFTFVWCCEVLGLSPTAAREAALKPRQSGRLKGRTRTVAGSRGGVLVAKRERRPQKVKRWESNCQTSSDARSTA